MFCADLIPLNSEKMSSGARLDGGRSSSATSMQGGQDFGKQELAKRELSRQRAFSFAGDECGTCVLAAMQAP